MFKDTLNMQNNGAFTAFSIFAFVLAVGMMAGGIYNLEASFAAKGFYAMASIMLVHTSITITKTLRDVMESQRLNNKLDEARAEKLLREMDTTNE